MAADDKAAKPAAATQEDKETLTLATEAQNEALRSGGVKLVEDPVFGKVPATPLGEDGKPVRTQGEDEKGR